ncbi:hypothetical protein Scep_020684 [Stephania cephalantha]|uniref:Uncharacterized protein n=1 Tax=Stephania cephalantha TaxID=152367 RepID=A0AAP0IDA8_9MAGN
MDFSSKEVLIMDSQRKQANDQSSISNEMINIRTKNKDYMDHAVAFLEKRDGLENCLSIAMYASRVILSTSHHHQQQQHLAPSRLERFHESLRLTRQALHLGKFIEDLNKLRKLEFGSHQDLMTLNLMAHGGSGLHHFLEQFLWLEKTGLISDDGGGTFNKLDKLSNYAELVGYVGSLGLKSISLVETLQRERNLESRIRGERTASSSDNNAAGGGDHNELVMISGLKGEMIKVKEEKLKQQIQVARCFLDVAVKLALIRGEHLYFGNPFFAALKGLVLSILTTRKIWSSSY